MKTTRSEQPRREEGGKGEGNRRIIELKLFPLGHTESAVITAVSQRIYDRRGRSPGAGGVKAEELSGWRLFLV